MLNKRENTPIVPREEERKSEQTRIDISVERPEIDNGQDSQDINFSIKKFEKHMIGMRQLSIVLEVCVNAALKSLAQNFWSIWKNCSNVL